MSIEEMRSAPPGQSGLRSELDYVAPTDVLFRDPSLPYATNSSVLGLRVEFRTNSRRVLAMICEAYPTRAASCGATEEDAQRAGTAASTVDLHVQVVVYNGAPGDGDSAAVRHICPDPYRVLIHGPGGMAVVDPLRREALIYASDGLIGDAEAFRAGFLEAATLALVTHFDRQPIHAAAIRNEGKILLLMGPSGAGKSTLAYLSRTVGFAVLSEDIVWAQLEPSLNIWSMPRAIHLLDDAGRHFPELSARSVSLQPNGKIKMSVPLEHDVELSPPVTNVVVCLLKPRCAAAGVGALTPRELEYELLHDSDPGFDRYPDRRAACTRALSENGGWRLSLSEHAHDVLPFLM
ncbi:MAG TPA: hypothetical protein VIG47_16200, partial [Gemmatimonadaceae bacterium]